ncbi:MULTISPECIES: recombinase family protein [Nocardiaceae]|uniref:recombinase family protein n=1 Tax=Nocardiaceae TaxID=85025 RepID=UPI00050BFC7A|nr:MULTISPECIES: recombinase family protein [Rhodococcus]OZF41333.1 DNA invertase [Rhodococcus sp. 14-2470-1a]OZF41350.1 DNA invertase [Rhodococcus sp. 14-2470-1a]
MGELLGYARVSTTEQSADAQRDALSAAGCSRVWVETASGATTSRPELSDLFSHLRSGDTLVVWRLDRLGRSLPHLLQTVEDLDSDGVGFRSLTESIDTTTSGGKLIYSIFGALAEFERNLIRERTQLGLAAARAQGRTGGRPRSMSEAKIKQARRMRAGGMSLADIRDVVGVSRSTLYRYLK